MFTGVKGHFDQVFKTPSSLHLQGCNVITIIEPLTWFLEEKEKLEEGLLLTSTLYRELGFLDAESEKGDDEA